MGTQAGPARPHCSAPTPHPALGPPGPPYLPALQTPGYPGNGEGCVRGVGMPSPLPREQRAGDILQVWGVGGGGPQPKAPQCHVPCSGAKPRVWEHRPTNQPDPNAKPWARPQKVHQSELKAHGPDPRVHGPDPKIHQPDPNGTVGPVTSRKYREMVRGPQPPSTACPTAGLSPGHGSTRHTPRFPHTPQTFLFGDTAPPRAKHPPPY